MPRLQTPDEAPTSSGYKSVCERRINGIPARIRTSSHDDQMPGKEELVLEYHAVTLWSL
ncbi:hypothetical protein ABZ379_06425 [Streptomyces canus]|uniref:hypothetical protein n=1 Tax=Streptomyces canus TaxID=58343 RepID=UPI0033EE56A5